MKSADWDFIKDGLEFSCQGSGKCCTSRGEFGYVYVLNDDIERLAQYFKTSISDIKANYCEQSEGWYHFKNPSANCIYLQDKKCGIYEARPAQCRSWPFWKQNLNPKTWASDVLSECVGAGSGRRYSALEILKISDGTFEASNELINLPKNNAIKTETKP